MILLRPDCLVFETKQGLRSPRSAFDVTVELVGDQVEMLGDTFLRQAAEAVLHFFKDELGRTSVSVKEFSLALEKVLRGFGLEVELAGVTEDAPRVVEADLGRLASESGDGLELFFFPRLRAELRRNLADSPEVLRFRGLRTCVKRLLGARRWTQRCQGLNDQIVEYVRTCFASEPHDPHCALVLR